MILHRHNRRFACSGCQCDVTEPEFPGILDIQSSAEPHSANEPDVVSPQQRQVHHGQKGFVPTDSDPVFRDTSKSGQNPLVEFLFQRFEFPNGCRAGSAPARQRIGDRFELQTVDSDNAKPFVCQIVGERISGRPQTDHQHIDTVVRKRIGPLPVERIESCEQTVDFESEWKFKYITDDPGFGLRDVDGFLLLKNASLHAVVADPVPRSRTHRIIEYDHGQRRDDSAPFSQDMHFGNTLFQRAARERDSERIFLPSTRLLVAKSVRARIFFSRMADDAIVDLTHVFFATHTRISQLESVAMASMLDRSHDRLGQFCIGPLDLNQLLVVERGRADE